MRYSIRIIHNLRSLQPGEKANYRKKLHGNTTIEIHQTNTRRIGLM